MGYKWVTFYNININKNIDIASSGFHISILITILNIVIPSIINNNLYELLLRDIHMSRRLSTNELCQNPTCKQRDP